MKIFAPKETDPIETRASLDPAAAQRLAALGAEVVVESGIGDRCGHPDDAYAAAGATVTTDRSGSLAAAGLILRVRKPPADEVAPLRSGAVHIGFLDPFHERELIGQLASRGVSAISLEMVPRTSLAQKMDAISSQASLAGYVAAVVAANHLGAVFPMMMTPAGTISPAKVFVLGIGVAGLQAIATAKRLGARVTAFDVRPEALEQAESLGARALRIDLGETGGTDQGYARELTPGQLETQRAAQARVCADSDVVITTAKVFGRKPPVLVRADVVAAMKPGSVVVDLAAEAGGNVEGVVPGEIATTANGVKLIGLANFEGRVARHATQVLAANLANMVEHFWDPDAKAFAVRPDDEIQRGCLLTHGGQIVHERFRHP